jgi:hypothetical protein
LSARCSHFEFKANQRKEEDKKNVYFKLRQKQPGTTTKDLGMNNNAIGSFIGAAEDFQGFT